MNNIQNAYNYHIDSSVTDEIYCGYISHHTLSLFIEIDENQDENELKLLELNLIEIERYIKQGQIFEIQSDLDTIAFHNKSDFYSWCRVTLSYSFNLFIRNRCY